MKVWKLLLILVLFLLSSSVHSAFTNTLECINGETNERIADSVVIGTLVKCRIKSTNSSGDVTYADPVNLQYQQGGGGRFYGAGRAISGWVSVGATKLGKAIYKVVFAGVWVEKIILVKTNAPDDMYVEGLPDEVDIRDSNNIPFSIKGVFGDEEVDISSKVNTEISANGIEGIISVNNGVVTVDKFRGDDFVANFKFSMGEKTVEKNIRFWGLPITIYPDKVSVEQENIVEIIKPSEIRYAIRNRYINDINKRIFIKMPESGDDTIIFMASYNDRNDPKFKYYDMKVNVNGSWNPPVYRGSSWKGEYKELYLYARHSFDYQMVSARFSKTEKYSSIEKNNNPGILWNGSNYSKLIKESFLELNNVPDTSGLQFGYSCPSNSSNGHDDYPSGVICAKKVDLSLTGSIIMKDEVEMMRRYDDDQLIISIPFDSPVGITLEEGYAQCRIYSLSEMNEVPSNHTCNQILELEKGEYLVKVSPDGSSSARYDSSYKVQIKMSDSFDMVNWEQYLAKQSSGEPDEEYHSAPVTGMHTIRPYSTSVVMSSSKEDSSYDAQTSSLDFNFSGGLQTLVLPNGVPITGSNGSPIELLNLSGLLMLTDYQFNATPKEDFVFAIRQIADNIELYGNNGGNLKEDPYWNDLGKVYFVFGNVSLKKAVWDEIKNRKLSKDINPDNKNQYLTSLIKFRKQSFESYQNKEKYLITEPQEEMLTSGGYNGCPYIENEVFQALNCVFDLPPHLVEQYFKDQHNIDVSNAILVLDFKKTITSIPKKIFKGKQARHVYGTNDWKKEGQKSYFYSNDDAQKVLDAFHSGKTNFIGYDKQKRILISYDGVTGYNVNKLNGIYKEPTNIFVIKGEKKISIYPESPNYDISIWKKFMK